MYAMGCLRLLPLTTGTIFCIEAPECSMVTYYIIKVSCKKGVGRT